MGFRPRSTSTTPAPGLHVPSPIEELEDDRLIARGVRLLLKRDDLIHPELPGNKWRKLKYNLAAARDAGHHTLLTFGGAYSNHVRAVAAAGRLFGFATIGVIRGEEHLPLNPSLAYAVGQGMRLSYMDRRAYRHKGESAIIQRLRALFGEFYLLPEGGSNALAVQGCAELPAEIAEPFEVICCPCGTGGTLAGIAVGLREGQGAVGFSVLKGADFLTEEVQQLQLDGVGRVTDNWRVELGFHFGGFAKRTPGLDEFRETFRCRHGILLDWVYVAKMMYGVFALVDRGSFRPGSTIVAVVTG